MSLLILREGSQFPVVSGAPFITLSANVSNITVTKGQTRDIVVYVERTGYLDVVTLGVTGLPTGVTVSYPDGQTIPNGTPSRVVRFTADAGMASVSGQSITLTASGDDIASVGLGRTLNVIDSSSVTPTYNTDFEALAAGTNSASGFAPINNSSWGYWYTLVSNRITADSETTLLPSGYPGATSPTKALRFRFAGTTAPNDAWSEARFLLYNPVPELWIEYQLFCPANYIHRTQSGSLNNKFFRIWRENAEYGPNICKLGVDTYRSSNTVSTGWVGANEYPSSSFSPFQSGTTLISATGPIVIGEWNVIRFHCKTASSATSDDGIFKMWVNGSLYASKTDGAFYPWDTTLQNQSPYFRSMYFMGAANSGFTDTTLFLIDDLKMYDQNPGW